MNLGQRSEQRSTSSSHPVGVRPLASRLAACWWETSVGALVLFTALSRLPFRTSVPFNWDAVDYIWALKDFDLARDQPHPPGNPVYVLAGRAAHLVIADPNQAYIFWSVVASAVAVWAVALLGARLASRPIGLWAALLLALNPIFWLNGEAALAYAPEIAIATLTALAAWRAFQRPTPTSAALLGISLALAGGLRPTLLPLLAPVYLFGLWRLAWRDRFVAVGSSAAACLAWLVPLLWVVGGISRYRELSQLQAAIPASHTSLLDGDLRGWLGNVRFFAVTLAGALNLLLLPVLVSLRRVRPAGAYLSPRAVLLWLWLLPATGTYLFVHFGQIGYMLLILPPILLLCLFQIDRAWPRGIHLGRPVPWLLAAILGCVFLAIPMLASLRDDAASWTLIEQRVGALPSAQTLVLTTVAGTGLIRLAAYELPSYRALGVDGKPGANWGVLFDAYGGQDGYRLDTPSKPCQVVPLGGITQLVAFDHRLTDHITDRANWSATTLPNGLTYLSGQVPLGMRYLDLSGGQVRFVPAILADEASYLCRLSAP